MDWTSLAPIFVAVISFISGPMVGYSLKRRELIDARKVNDQLNLELKNAKEALGLPSMLSSEEYGITIDSPTDFGHVGKSFRVSGTFTNLHEGQVVWVSTFGVYEDSNGKKKKRYWPQEPAKISYSNNGKQWKSN